MNAVMYRNIVLALALPLETIVAQPSIVSPQETFPRVSSGECDIAAIEFEPLAIDVFNEFEVASLPGELFGELLENKDDPAYKLYRAGYNLILDEEWEKARKKFGEIIKQYPKSEYLDDAEYWSAYALKHTDTRNATDAYKKFIANFPNSMYFDDASADLRELVPLPLIIGKSGDKVVISEGADSGSVDEEGFTLGRRAGKGFSYSYSYGPNTKIVERALRTQTRALKRVRWPRIPAAPAIPPLGGSHDEEGLDQETRLKMEALYAIGNTKEDSTSFRTLRDVALDRSHALQLRIAAMEELVDFKKHDPLPIFLKIAKKDTSEEIQNSAIDFIGMLTKDRNRSVETLVELFNAIPKSRTNQRENIFYAIAEVGNDRAVDFLANIARTHENYDLRGEAVYYLGSIGSDKARAALYEILKGE